MPSGSKKRKAAKKKKEQAANSNNSSTNKNPHGNDDPKSQDERDSDGGDVGSPASQDDHNHQHPFSLREGGGKRVPSPAESHVTEEKSTRDADSTEKSGLDDVDIKIEKDREPQEGLESVHDPLQHVEHDKSSSCSSKSNSSSSDDESQAFEKKSKEEAYNIGSEGTSYGNENKSAAVVPEEVLNVAENETLRDVDSNSAVEIAAVENLVKPVLSVAEAVGHVTEISVNKSVSDVVESGLNESEAELLPSSNGISRVELEENEGKVFPSSSTPPQTSDVAGESQHSGPYDYSEKQPPAASTPMVQRTSLCSCCGLFDVFTGSGR